MGYFSGKQRKTTTVDFATNLTADQVDAKAEKMRAEWPKPRYTIRSKAHLTTVGVVYSVTVYDKGPRHG